MRYPYSFKALGAKAWKFASITMPLVALFSVNDDF